MATLMQFAFAHRDLVPHAVTQGDESDDGYLVESAEPPLQTQCGLAARQQAGGGVVGVNWKNSDSNESAAKKQH
ncbi:MAG: hypothetical protein NTW87_09625 [Planctomycetota bacterium]|nr:hypothetical protein [Planctomycetota bacterium]